MNLMDRIEGAKRQAQLQTKSHSNDQDSQIVLTVDELALLKNYCKLSREEVSKELSRILNYIEDFEMKKIVEEVCRKLKIMNNHYYASLDFSAVTYA